ncbi:MAG TPA: phosphatase PAP2 family protein [Bacteroidales bacterium]|nr:phosphatase PAP2 family protein [Bacteroidales bacterium]MDI9573036.1 phosphatase PAP2 family protein [Bacteroidota bacterium]OQC59156.1 MAG: PAP2 superfamily protein [Bacteroidetes bacterium ADurb.Bin012]MBP9511767.1 phosphatase PAP2 family protein [Bacteroidales bacterium]MBP9589387.1 phosphatase PAP2 family protein [Bacteroidales bacterium]
MASTKTHKVHYSTISSISSIKKYIFKGSPIKLVGILLFFVSSTVMGGDTLSFTAKTYFKSYFTDAFSIITLPKEMTDADWAFAGFAATSGGWLMAYDKEAYDFIRDKRGDFTQNISRYFLEPLGSGLITLPALLAMYGYNQWQGQSYHSEAALQAIKAFIISATFAEGAKLLLHRWRPSKTDDPYRFDGPSLSFERDAMPSEHTSTAFAVATVLAEYYHDNWLITAVSYSMASLVGLSRIHDGKHWPSDVFAGALLGYTVGKTVSKHGNSLKNKKIIVHPLVNSYETRICIIYRL